MIWIGLHVIGHCTSSVSEKHGTYLCHEALEEPGCLEQLHLGSIAIPAMEDVPHDAEGCDVEDGGHRTNDEPANYTASLSTVGAAKCTGAA